MDIRRLTDDFAVSPQITAEELDEIASAGFRAILCNRPDDEEPGQPEFDTIAAAARAAGLEARAVPIVSGMITDEAVAAFRAALDELPAPVFAYCRSGTRCTMLWAVTRLGEIAPAEIARRAAQAGYDVSGLLRQLGVR